MALSWTEVWPLFVILVGVASPVSTSPTGVTRRALLWSFTWPIVDRGWCAPAPEHDVDSSARDQTIEQGVAVLLVACTSGS